MAPAADAVRHGYPGRTRIGPLAANAALHPLCLADRHLPDLDFSGYWNDRRQAQPWQHPPRLCLGTGRLYRRIYRVDGNRLFADRFCFYRMADRRNAGCRATDRSVPAAGIVALSLRQSAGSFLLVRRDSVIVRQTEDPARIRVKLIRIRNADYAVGKMFHDPDLQVFKMFDDLDRFRGR